MVYVCMAFTVLTSRNGSRRIYQSMGTHYKLVDNSKLIRLRFSYRILRLLLRVGFYSTNSTNGVHERWSMSNYFRDLEKMIKIIKWNIKCVEPTLFSVNHCHKNEWSPINQLVASHNWQGNGTRVPGSQNQQGVNASMGAGQQRARHSLSNAQFN